MSKENLLTPYSAVNLRAKQVPGSSKKNVQGILDDLGPKVTDLEENTQILLDSSAGGLPDMFPTEIFDFRRGIDSRFSQLRASSKYIRNAFGNMVEVPPYTSAPGFHPVTKKSLGYRGSPAVTYQGVESENIAAGWSFGNTIGTANARVGPDGFISATKIEAGVNGPGTATKTIIADVAVFYYVVSIYKGSGADTANRFAVYNNTTAVDVISLSVNYDTGVVTQAIGSGATTEPIPGGWLLKIPVTTGIAVGNTISLYAVFTGGAMTLGQHAFIGQPFVTSSDKASYHPTGPTSFTRPADMLVMDLVTHDYIVNPHEFTVVCSFLGSNLITPTSGLGFVFNISDSGAGALQLRLGYVGGSIRADLITPLITHNLSFGVPNAGKNVIALSLAPSGFSGRNLNGSYQTTGAITVPVFTHLGVGCFVGADTYESGADIEILGFYPRGCSDSELEAIVNIF